MATPPTPKHRFCSECGTPLNPGARFCHNCAAPVGGRAEPATVPASAGGNALRWGVPVAAFLALLVLSVIQFGSRPSAADSPPGMPPENGAVAAPDISSMSPAERADRLFNRVMRLSSEGKSDSAAFFGPMALSALEALLPLDAHRRYDIGLIQMAIGDTAAAAAQADTILRQRPTHLLGLVLAARAAEARGGVAAGREYRRRFIAAEPAERKRALPEYQDHAADIQAAITASPKP